MKEFFQRRIAQPILKLLRQGTSPEKLALSIAFGLVVGIFPALGWTTLLCLAATFIFRLNLPAVQLINHLAYPLQLALLIPFIRAGEFVFHASRLPLSIPQIFSMIKTDVWHAIKVLWVATVHAVAVWAVLAPLAILGICWALTPMLKKFAAVSGLGKSAVAAPAAGK
jgi:uncharacterized protein (DUF2062 family)